MMSVDETPQLHPFFAKGSKEIRQFAAATDDSYKQPTARTSQGRVPDTSPATTIRAPVITEQAPATTAQMIVSGQPPVLGNAISNSFPHESRVERSEPRQMLLSDLLGILPEGDKPNGPPPLSTVPASVEHELDADQPRKRRKLSNEDLLTYPGAPIEPTRSLANAIPTGPLQPVEDSGADTTSPPPIPVSIEEPPPKPTPVNPLTAALNGVAPPRRKRGRPRKTDGQAESVTALKKARRKELRVVLKYAKGEKSATDGLGTRINAILCGDLRVMVAKPKGTPAPSKNAAASNRPIHPYFMSKSAKASQLNPGASSAVDRVQQDEVSRRVAFSSPGKMRAEALARKETDRAPRLVYQQPSITKKTRSAEHADAPWPPKDTAHVRGDLEQQYLDLCNAGCDDLRQPRGEKKAAPKVDDSDITSQSGLYSGNRDALSASPDAGRLPVHLPQRDLTSGTNIRKELERQMSSVGVARNRQVLDYAFANAPDRLTAWDAGKYEKELWINKYSPGRSEELLGNTKNALILKDWLSSSALTGNEVSSKGTMNAFARMTQKSKKPKKRKRHDDLDDFIVSEEEAETKYLAEVSEDESLQGSNLNPSKRSLVREGRENMEKDASGRRIHNCVLLSGAHGSGKTAAVYAVARELGFEVFEINAGARRSGRDVLDKVEYMVANHLVHRNASRPTAATEGDETPVEEVVDPKQSSMKSFFQTKGKELPASAKLKPQETTAKPTSEEPTEPELKTTRGLPKQSLILLEEVDVLYESDKQFWATITTLATHSKRPIILTCNDESCISMESLPLFAILRFESPPADPTIDWLLLCAAREGHLLSRDAVKTLYEIRHHDLRGAMMDLNFWCQMAVGDRKGGLEWILPRWPPGTDVDQNGQLLRVASRGTFSNGMGLLNADLLQPNQYIAGDETEIAVLETWRTWGIDMDEIAEGIRPCLAATSLPRCRDQPLATLRALDGDADLASVADLFRTWATPSPIKEPVDATLPLPPPGAKSDSMEGRQVLYAHPVVHYSQTPAEIAAYFSIKSSQNRKHFPSQDPHIGSCTLESSLVDTIKMFSMKDLSNQEIIRPGNLDPSMIGALSEATFCGGAVPPDDPLAAAALAYRGITDGATDIAPFVRSIASFDQAMEAQRLRLSNLLSVGGRPPRMRTTRASRSALEGGKRETTRRERWFSGDLNLELVMRSGGRDWAGYGSWVPGLAADASVSSQEHDVPVENHPVWQASVENVPILAPSSRYIHIAPAPPRQ